MSSAPSAKFFVEKEVCERRKEMQRNMLYVQARCVPNSKGRRRKKKKSQQGQLVTVILRATIGP